MKGVLYMRNCCCCCPPTCCCNCQFPCPPGPPAPGTLNDIFVAAGTGIDPFGFINLTMDIPLGNALYSNGNFIRHSADSAEFTILETGKYEINYQASAYNPVLESSIDIDITVSLMSNLSGALDRVLFTRANRLEQRSVRVNLSVGEIVFLRASQPYPSEMAINSQAITIIKLN